MEFTWTRLKSVKVVKPASRQTACTRRLSVADSSVPERHRGCCPGPGERNTRSREIPDLACQGEMTSSLVTGVTVIRRAVNKTNCTNGNNI